MKNEVTIVFSMYGSMVCAMWKDQKNLAEYLAGFGDSPKQAIDDLLSSTSYEFFEVTNG